MTLTTSTESHRQRQKSVDNSRLEPKPTERVPFKDQSKETYAKNCLFGSILNGTLSF